MVSLVCMIGITKMSAASLKPLLNLVCAIVLPTALKGHFISGIVSELGLFFFFVILNFTIQVNIVTN